MTIKTAGKPRQIHATGRQPIGATMIVAYLHGKGGDRKQGQNDSRFGGNFNRIRNLMLLTAASMSRRTFPILAIRARSRSRPFWRRRSRRRQRPKCSSPAAQWAASSVTGLRRMPNLRRNCQGCCCSDRFQTLISRNRPSSKAKLPLFIGHGGGDKTSPIDGMEAFYASIRKASPGYPVWLHRFETGSHGTPVRMSRLAAGAEPDAGRALGISANVLRRTLDFY